MKLLTILFLMTFISLGCSYIEKRANDFGDCFKLNTDMGIGVHASCSVFIFGAGVGYWEGYRWGHFGEGGIRHGYTRCWGSPFPHVAAKSSKLLATASTAAQNLGVVISKTGATRGYIIFPFLTKYASEPTYF